MWWLLIPIGIVGLMAAFFVLMIAAALWEKRKVISFALPEPGQELPPTDYARQANAIVSQLGFQHYGTFHDGTSALYRIRYDLWVSPEGTTVALIGGGTLARIPVKGSWFVSPLSDGRYLLTTDELGETELSGLADLEILTDTGVTFLAARHQHRVATWPVPVARLSDDPLADYLRMRQRQTERKVELGLARYLDPERTTWKYTLNGALKFYFVSIWLQPYTKHK